MKNIVIKIVILGLCMFVFSCSVYATEENVPTNTTENGTEKEEQNNTQNATAQEPVEEKPTETEKNETMYVQERCNIRSSYSVDSDRVGGLDVGTEVTVIAEYSNGWYKIKYSDGEAYIKAAILRSTKPVIEEPAEPEKEPEVQPEQMQSTESIEGSTDEVDDEYATLINEIGVLPEVGNNVADILYGGVIILALVMIIYVKALKERDVE